MIITTNKGIGQNMLKFKITWMKKVTESFRSTVEAIKKMLYKHDDAAITRLDDTDKKEEITEITKITEMLIDIFDRIDIVTPSNFDSILDFIINDINEVADPKEWDDRDVAIAFRRWIESK